MSRIVNQTSVIEHNSAGNGRYIGTVAEIFGDDAAAHIVIGESHGEDSQRGAYAWWTISLNGEDIGELRDDAGGLTVHIND